MKKIYILIIFLFYGICVKSQQPLYNQYMLNPYIINPSIAGYNGYTDINLMTRQQWVGYDNGPSTYAISGQHRILKTSYRNRSRLIKNNIRRKRPSGKVGIGGIIYNDTNGSIVRTGLQGTYSYHIYVRDIQYSMGFSLSMFQFKTNIEQKDFYEQDIIDPILQNNNSIFSPDANIGFLISSDDYYAGISISNLFQNNISFGNDKEFGFKLNRHYYILGGYKYQKRRSDYSFEPSVMITLTEKLLWNIDLNIKAIYMDNYWAGLSYRSSGSIISMFGLKYTNYYLGYSFDLSWSDVSTFNKYGSHELLIGIRFGDNARRYRWLNRF